MNRFRRNSATQKVQTFDTLVTFLTGSDGSDGTIDFKVPCPDSRMRIKVSLLFQPPAGTDLSTLVLTASLWLREADIDMSGVTGDLVPLANIEGTQAAPTAIPKAAGLLGYSREFSGTAADFIVGTLAVTSTTTAEGGSWVLQVRYQPQAVRFTDNEWNEIEPNCNPSLLDSALRIAA